jgi:hypothetical protein
MALKQTSWAHGNAVQVEGHAHSVTYRGFWATITPQLGSGQLASGVWAHLPIPTPVIQNGTRLKAHEGLIRF